MKQSHLIRQVAFVFVILMLPLTVLAGENAIWSDGSKAPAPEGKILTDNSHGRASILTGVTYHYLKNKPTNPHDSGNRLLDGHITGNWHTPVGVNYKPLVVAFDFKRPCSFNEIAVHTRRANPMTIKLSVRGNKNSKWQIIAKLEEPSDYHSNWHRVKLNKPAKGRYLRLSIKNRSGNITYVSEVMAWGEAKVSKQYPQIIDPIRPKHYKANKLSNSKAVSIPGIKSTRFSHKEFKQWYKSLPSSVASHKAVWSKLPTWGKMAGKPILPDKQNFLHQLSFTLAKGGSGYAAIALTNTNWNKALNTKVKLSAFQRVDTSTAMNSKKHSDMSGVLRVGGAIVNRKHRVVIGPLFGADNLLGTNLMHKYLTNGKQISHFPKLTLGKAGSAILWLYIDTTGALPGVYKAKLKAQDATPIIVKVTVKNITLLHPDMWVNGYSGLAGRTPFISKNLLKTNIVFTQRLGFTVWSGFPTKGSVKELARKIGHTIFYKGILPHGYRKLDLTKKKDRQKVIDKVHKVVDKAKSLGLKYDQWAASLWDEPGPKSLAPGKRFSTLASIIHKADPHVRIYCNPLYWFEPHHGTDKQIYNDLSPWYNKQINVSVPNKYMLSGRPVSLHKIFTYRPRSVNAWYAVKGDIANIEKSNVLWYRRMSWFSFAHKMNGWGFYAYFQPRGNPWNDLDESRHDYGIVYPGPHGPIPTRKAAAMRRGWDDYRLMMILKKQGQEKTLNHLIKSYKDGASMSLLRREALHAAVAWENKHKN